MEHAFFIGDLLDEVGKLTIVQSYNLRFEEYEIEEIKGKKFIVGKGRPANPFKNENVFEGPELLFSLINLVKGPLPKYFNEPHMDSVISDESIMKWCKKYGIPYRDTELNRLLEDEKWRDNILHLGMFKYKIAWLYAYFSLWKAIISEDQEEINKYRDFVKLEMETIKMLPDGPKKDDLTYLKEALTAAVDKHFRVNIHLVYNSDSKTYEFKLASDSLIIIAYYQLASLMTKNHTENKKKMKNCAYCQSIYWANHANSRYCPNCDRRTVWSRRNSKKKK